MSRVFSKQLKRLLSNKNEQEKLTWRLQDSQINARNQDNSINMSVGKGREADLISLIIGSDMFEEECLPVSDNKDAVDLKVTVNGQIENIQIKHIELSKTKRHWQSGGIKVKWTSNAAAAEKHKKEFIKSARAKQLPSFIIGVLGFGTITYHYIPAKSINATAAKLGMKMFAETSAHGNTRGIAARQEFWKMAQKHPDAFSVQWTASVSKEACKANYGYSKQAERKLMIAPPDDSDSTPARKRKRGGAAYRLRSSRRRTIVPSYDEALAIGEQLSDIRKSLRELARRDITRLARAETERTAIRVR